MKKYSLLLCCVSWLLNCGDSAKLTLSNADVYESSAQGSLVGQIELEKPKDDVFYTFALTDDASGRFEVTGNQLRVVDGRLLDFEKETQHAIKVKVEGNDGSSKEQEFTINVLDIQLEVSTLANSGAGSLRNLIANAQSGDRIGFKSSLSGTIKLPATPIEISKKITIHGPGASIIEISGEDAIAMFEVTEDGVFNISGVTLKKGANSAISNNGKTTISESVVKNNTAGWGGGLYNSATMAIRNCIISGNSAFNAGGIGNQGTMTIHDSSIINNISDGNSGGGLITYGNMIIVNSTFSGNQTAGMNRPGGAILCIDGTEDPLKLFNVTITDNHSTGNGGGISAINCEVELKNSIVAQNTTDAAGPDVDGDVDSTIVSRGYNLIGNGQGSSLVDGEKNDQVGAGAGIDALLKPLADNGGYGRTHSFDNASPALDQIPAASCVDEDGKALKNDQRGFLRPVNTKCDIGALER